MPPKIPSTLKFGSIVFDVWQLGDGRFAFDYQDGSRRVVVKRRKLEDLKTEASRISTDLLNGETDSLQLDAPTRRICVAALDSIAPTGLHLDAVARDVAEAWKLTGGKSILELARFFAGRSPSMQAAPPTEEIVREFIAVLREKGRSDKYYEALERDLGYFANKFPDLQEATDKTLHAYLQALRKKGPKGPKGEPGPELPVGTRRRDNVRDAIVSLFNFAKKRKYLAEDRKTAADHLERINTGSDITTYSPGQMVLLLENVSHAWRPWMAIAAFAGLRTSEIFRLEWSSIKWDQNVIAVSRRVARKIRISRKVPITKNLMTWLLPYRNHHGRIYTPEPTWEALESRHGTELERLRKKTGIIWEANALRHSFGSHRLAIVKSEAQVAMEMGNSVAKVRENYNDPKSEGESKTYFGLMPPESADNVIPLALEFR